MLSITYYKKYSTAYPNTIKKKKHIVSAQKSHEISNNLYVRCVRVYRVKYIYKKTYSTYYLRNVVVH